MCNSIGTTSGIKGGSIGTTSGKSHLLVADSVFKVLLIF